MRQLGDLPQPGHRRIRSLPELEDHADQRAIDRHRRGTAMHEVLCASTAGDGRADPLGDDGCRPAPRARDAPTPVGPGGTRHPNTASGNPRDVRRGVPPGSGRWSQGMATRSTRASRAGAISWNSPWAARFAPARNRLVRGFMVATSLRSAKERLWCGGESGATAPWPPSLPPSCAPKARSRRRPGERSGGQQRCVYSYPRPPHALCDSARP